MRILHLALGFYPAQAWGGPVKVIHQNAKELVRRGHSVTVYCTNLLNKADVMRPGTFEGNMDGIRVVYFDTWHLSRWPGTLGPFWLPDLPVYLRRELPVFDVVHLNGYRSPMMFTAARAARVAGVPIVTQPHGTLPAIISSLWAKRAYDRLFGGGELRGIGALVALQEPERQNARERGIPNELIEIIPNGIDPAERETVPERGSIRRRFGLDAKKPLILFLARINQIKGTDMLLQAFARMRDAGAMLMIAGPDDGQLAEVRALVSRLSLSDRVLLPGLLSGPDVLAALRDADLFVLPSRSDAFPFAVVEACLMRTPMVITDRCAISQLVEGRIGDVVPFDAGAFAVAMERLLTDRERHERYRLNAAKLLEEHFSIRAVVDRLEAVYRRVIQERKLEAIKREI